MSGNTHQHVPGCHLRTCCFPFKVTLEDKLPFQLCLKQHQLCVCKTRLCCSIMNLPPNLPALRSELQGKMICQQSSLAMPPHSCHHPLPSIAQCSCMSSCCHPGDGDRDGFPSAPPGKSRCSAPPSPLCRRQRQQPGLCRATPCRLPVGSAAALLASPGRHSSHLSAFSPGFLQALATSCNPHKYKLSPTMCRKGLQHNGP